MILFNSQEITIIAEIGVNHEGNLHAALRMLELAAATGVNVVKFQAYTPALYASASDQQRLERVTKFALDKNQFEYLALKSNSLNIEFLCTPVTEDWVEVLNPLCRAFKIASGDITFKPVIKKAAQTGKPLIISTGAATVNEIDQAVEWVSEEIGSENLEDRLMLMHCVSAYPTPIEQANMLSIPFLKDRYGLDVGYSNHVIGVEACLAAVALGANVIEVHFTDCKEGREFRDHSLSFDPGDLETFIKMARKVKASLGVYAKEPQECEKGAIPVMRKGIVAERNLKAGDVLKETDLMFARPATEFSSNDLPAVIGKKLTKDISKGYLITKDAI